MKWVKWLVSMVVGLIVLSVIGILIAQRVSDGPMGPLTGSSFTSGEWVNEPPQDWSVLNGDFEFELVGEGTSRTAGGVMLGDQVYITCDLGFIWSRLPDGLARNMLHVIWWFKDWHLKAEQDGRVVIRKDGRLYPVMITRVQDPEVIEGLKVTLEELAAGYFAPTELGPRPTEAPNDIWFFSVDFRPVEGT